LSLVVETNSSLFSFEGQTTKGPWSTESNWKVFKFKSIVYVLYVLGGKGS